MTLLPFGLVFAWYDFWIGAYYDREKRVLYLLPLPCIGFWVKLARWECSCGRKFWLYQTFHHHTEAYGLFHGDQYGQEIT